MFYKLLLEKENMHHFKRFYLLGAIILAIGIPLMTFTYYVEPSQEIIQDITLESTTTNLEEQFNYLPIILWSIYSIGLFLFGFKFIRNLYTLSYKIKRNPKRKINNITNVLLQDLITPHTFFNYIFFNKNEYEAHEIPQEVLWHEETHATQKHSIDVVLIEALQVIFWFNPLLYTIKHLIKLNHEFLADQAVLRKGIKTTAYQQTLLAFSSNATQPQLANAINYSLIKKRFTVMKTQTTKRAIWIRSLVLLPLLAITLFSFSEKVIIEKESDLKTDSITNNVLLPIAQEKATKSQVKEYNKLAKKYNEMSQDDMIIKSKEIERLKYLYNLMSDDQKEKAEAFPNIPTPPAPPVPLTVTRVKSTLAPPPPPPLPPNATEGQKKAYKEGYEAAKAALKVQKLKAQKARLIEVKEVRTAEDRKRIKEEKLVYRESQNAAKVLKLKAQKEKLVQVREVQVAKLKKERMAQKADLVKVREIRSNEERKRLKEVKLADRESQVAARVLKLKTQKGELAKVREIRTIKLKEERIAQKESQVAARVLKQKALKEKRIKVREVPPPPPPKSPLEHIKDMEKKGATFYFEGKTITANKAIKLMRSKRKLNVITNHTDNNNYVVTLSTKPIVIED